MRQLIFWIISLAVLVSSVSSAGDATFSWLPNPEDTLAGYRIYEGSTSRKYDVVHDVGLPPTEDGRVGASIPIIIGQRYYAATAYDEAGGESAYSIEVMATWLPSPNIIILR